MFHPNRSRRAFTLVELLSVVAIIVAILALVLPSISSMRQRARSVSCMANIRSLQAAGLEITGVKDVTPQAHNGCRPRKRRRV